ncbi:MAG: ATP-dependent helicase, partial [Nitrospiraceae bacterium]|nr:ATP-dependent helicase [Nitrospiraceae bacterium]
MSLSESPEIPLNPEQEAAVLHEGGPLLVLAPAGSGKTRVVIERLIALIDRSGVGGEGFFVATFTRKAAGELSERITRRIPGARLPWVGTFHSLSARLLRRFSGPAGLSPDFTIFDAGDQKALVREIMRRHRISDEDVNPQDVLRQIGRWKNARQGPGPDL